MKDSVTEQRARRRSVRQQIKRRVYLALCVLADIEMRGSATVAVDHRELHLVALPQIVEAVVVDGGLVQEELARGLASDEREAAILSQPGDPAPEPLP